MNHRTFATVVCVDSSSLWISLTKCFFVLIRVILRMSPDQALPSVTNMAPSVYHLLLQAPCQAKSQLAIPDLTISRWATLFLTLSHKHMHLLACHNHNTTTVNRSMDVKEM
jgi:hypothetical protein